MRLADFGKAAAANAAAQRRKDWRSIEKERECDYSGGAKALPGKPFAPAITSIRGSHR